MRPKAICQVFELRDPGLGLRIASDFLQEDQISVDLLNRFSNLFEYESNSRTVEALMDIVGEDPKSGHFRPLPVTITGTGLSKITSRTVRPRTAPETRLLE